MQRNLLARMNRHARDRFGMTINMDKTKVLSRLHGITFLGYENRNSLPFKKSTELLASLAYPERETDWAILATQAIGIAWASAGFDPRVYDVCKDIYSFITDKLKITPRLQNWRQFEYLGLTKDDMSNFPSREAITAKLRDIFP